MHWSEEIAQRIIDKHPEKEEYVCAAGVSPSGSVHIGNFRDLATPLFVVKSLQKKGKKADTHKAIPAFYHTIHFIVVCLAYPF